VDISTLLTPDGLVVRVDETRIDAAVAIEFKEAVRAAAERPGNPVILDLSRVGFLDSSGLGAVVAVMKLLGPERPLQLAALTPPVAKVFRLTRMDSIFTIHDTAPGALKAAG
jgi:anti-sigma B factor antagonist